jgi:N-acetylglucosamine-6-phosphate deacetylase
VRNLHALGVPLAQALEAACTVPARVIGEKRRARLAVGLPADIVVLDDNLEVDRVFLAGKAYVVA